MNDKAKMLTALAVQAIKDACQSFILEGKSDPISIAIYGREWARLLIDGVEEILLEGMTQEEMLNALGEKMKAAAAQAERNVLRPDAVTQ